MAFILTAMATNAAQSQDTVQIVVQPSRARQVYDGVGAGAIFYEGHITSLAARNKNERQEQLYDDMFATRPDALSPAHDPRDPRAAER